jgi:hypothetical protein
VKQLLKGLAFAGVFSAAGLIAPEVQANVIDEVQQKQAQAVSEDQYFLVATYQSDTGVLFKSYSPKWNSVQQLKSLEEELLDNKHGEELSYLGEVIIFPDYPAGERVLGQYYAQYEINNMNYSKDRKIHIYGGNDYPTIEEVSYVLSHEYGHHFSYFQLIQNEKVLPENWLTSDYAQSRELSEIDEVHSSVNGSYEYSMAEIMAEDYVQLFGSENAIKQRLPMNMEIPTPFETEEVKKYWSEALGNGYQPEENMGLYVTDFHRDSFYPYYDLELMVTKGDSEHNTFIRGEGEYSKGASQSLLNLSTGMKSGWLKFDDFIYEKAGYLLDGSINKSLKLQGIQHQDEGFNIGSETLSFSYQDLSKTVTEAESLKKEDATYYTMVEKKELLTEIANKKGIPPEILKGIARAESEMMQFNADGTPFISSDGGIGIMQLTLSSEEMEARGIDAEALKWDTRYNIEIGADILLEKWNLRLPEVNNHDQSHIEDWYFSVMAYNGLSKRNDPTLDHEEMPYQERVFQYIRDYSLLEIGATPVIEINYPHPGAPDIMSFPEDKDYSWPTDTLTTQSYAPGDVVYTFNPYFSYSKLRDGIDGLEKMKLDHYSPLEIIGGPYETEANENNQYVMYKVSGNGFEGYIASANIQHAPGLSVFDDIKAMERWTAVAYLQARGIINGYPDGTYRPDQALNRTQAARLLINALDLELPEGYEMKATDLKPGQYGYEEMKIVEAHGLMGQGGELRAAENLSRTQMAAILVRAFEKYYEDPTKNYVIKDIPTTDWNYENINTLVHNQITVASETKDFNPWHAVSRAHFALFLQRTIELKESQE